MGCNGSCLYGSTHREKCELENSDKPFHPAQMKINQESILESAKGLQVAVQNDSFLSKTTAEDQEQKLVPENSTQNINTYFDINSTINKQFADKYILIKERIGQGANGKVYECKNQLNDQVYAAKIIKTNLMEQKTVDAMLQEMILMKDLQHSNIMSCVDFYREPNRLIIVMEKAQNDLQKFIRKHQQEKQYISENDVKFIFLHICLAVKYLHDRKMMHRDIKPGNVLLFNDRTIKVSDLGTVKQLKHSRATALSKQGTWQYWAPELFYDKTVYTMSVDIWALGVLLYELLTNCLPFKSFDSIRFKPFKPVETTDFQRPQNLLDILDLCLEKDPNDRPSIDLIIERIQKD